MCGINGVFAYHPSSGAPSESELLAVRDYMRARGPDGSGAWWDSSRRLGLGHRRLAIIDLSPRGAQPMASACGRYVIVFNGEIYNYPALRRTLEAAGRKFVSDSDTEALLHLYALKGAAMLADLRGMFAFAIWDNQARTLFLARDPYGIKPLYTANDGWTFRFASQVKALLASGKLSNDAEPAGVVGFHLWGSVPEPFTVHRDVRALPAGHWQLVDSAGPREPVAYTSIAKVIFESSKERINPADTNARIRAAALDSVGAHLLADVDVGLFLSAGVDSTALLGLMRDAGQSEIQAITLAFEEFLGTAEDEAPLARQAAETYGARHAIRTVTEAEFRVDLPAILHAMDQPSIDGVNTWFVSKAAREAGLKVALSGLGGDELLGGYPSFIDIPRWVNWLRLPAAIPGAGRLFRSAALALGLDKRSPKLPGMLSHGGSYAGAYLLRRSVLLPFELKTVLDRDVIEDGLRRLAPLKIVRGSMQPLSSSPAGRVAALESSNYMRNQLLRDADWAGMAHSLEIRTPLVDIELLRTLAPLIPQLRPGSGKAALAAAPSQPLPSSIRDRRKTGFVVPTGRWTASASAATAGSKGAASRAWAKVVISDAAAPLPRDTVAVG